MLSSKAGRLLLLGSGGGAITLALSTTTDGASPTASPSRRKVVEDKVSVCQVCDEGRARSRHHFLGKGRVGGCCICWEVDCLVD